jgi:N-hydroxyarylamine O-acetyltransferase
MAAMRIELLQRLHREFLGRVPYENLTVQLGESAPLDPAALEERVRCGRGGYCFELNTVLQGVLESHGFEVERRQAIVGPRDARGRGEPTNHLALVVEGGWLCDAGWGEGPLDPLPLREGSFTVGPFTWTLERDGDGWWVGQHPWGSTPGFWFSDAPAALEDFAPHHERLSRSPDSPFVQTLVVQQPRADRIVTLRARTLSVDGPAHRRRDVLEDREAFERALRDEFGITLDEERLARLWEKACAQHEAFLVRAATS